MFIVNETAQSEVRRPGTIDRPANMSLIPSLAILASPLVIIQFGFNWIWLGFILVNYGLLMLGITLGYHRLFSHRSFRTIKPLRYLLAVLGSMAWQGPLFWWVLHHRTHHLTADRPGDPHSPVCPHPSPTFGQRLKAFLHGHILWLRRDTYTHSGPDDPVGARAWKNAQNFLNFTQTEATETGRRHALSDLTSDRRLVLINKYHVKLGYLHFSLNALGGWLVTSNLVGAFCGFFWGGLVAVGIVQHVTWCINSVSHIFGSRPFRNKDESRNNWFTALTCMGEGWHNNHHAFPHSAKFGFKWWQIDFGGYVLEFLRRCRCVSSLKTVTEAQKSQKLRVVDND